MNLENKVIRLPVTTSNSAPEKIVAPAVLLAISFSDITFNIFGRAESSPLPLVFITASYFLAGRCSISAIYYTLGLLLFFLVGLANNIPFQTAVISLVAYIQLVVVYVHYKNNGIDFTSQLCRNIIYFHLAIGFMQFSGFFDGILTPLLSLLMPRGSGSALSEIGRGVTFVTTEPSHALQSVIFPLFILSVSPRFYDRVLVVLTLIVTLALSQAGLVMIYLLVFFGAVAMRNVKTALVVSVMGYLLVDLIPGRAGVALSQLSDFVGQLNFETLVTISQHSGFRFPSVIASLLGLGELPAIMGLGAWELNILDNLSAVGFDLANLGHWRHTGELHPIKPYSLLANIAADMWWFGVFPFFMFMAFHVRAYLKGYGMIKEPLPFAFYVLAIFSVLFLMTTGKPAFVAILGVIANFIHQKPADAPKIN